MCSTQRVLRALKISHLGKVIKYRADSRALDITNILAPLLAISRFIDLQLHEYPIINLPICYILNGF